MPTRERARVPVAVVLALSGGRGGGARYCREFGLRQENVPAARDVSKQLLQKLFNLSESILLGSCLNTPSPARRKRKIRVKALLRSSAGI